MSRRGPVTRIMVMGPPGSGKSTVALRLGERLSLPVTHLDALFHGPCWKPRAFEDFARDAIAVADMPLWVIDGNYTKVISQRLDRADLVILLETPRWVRMRRILARIVRHYGAVRPDSAPGCPERLDFGFLQYAWTWDRNVRPRVLKALACVSDKVVRLRGDADALPEAIRPPARASAA